MCGRARRIKGVHPTVPDIEPYPSEYPKIKHAYTRLSAMFANTKLTDHTVDAFHRAAIDLFAEAGFTIDVAWDQVHQNGRPTGLYMPEITISGRVHKESETDHDKLGWEITHGLADGQKGYIRQDGTKHEDPISKSIL